MRIAVDWMPSRCRSNRSWICGSRNWRRLLLSQRQLELSQAQKAASYTQTRCAGQLDAFDKKAEEIAKQYVDQLAALEKARTATATAFAEERASILKRGDLDIEAAERALETVQEAATSVQSAHTAKCGAALPPPGTEVQVTAVVSVPSPQQQAEQEQRELLAREQYKALTAEKARASALQPSRAEAREQLAALQPRPAGGAAFQEAINLELPTPPASEEVKSALYSLGQSLRLLAPPDEVIAVTWEDLSRVQPTWTDFLRLVPIQVAEPSVGGVVGTRAPLDPTHIVPRKLLELLRSQLDILAAQWSASSSFATQQAELTAQASQWATSVMDQAKRISERKRVPDATAEEAREPKKTAPKGDASNAK